MTALVDLIVRKHDGSLKAEHGTGLNMAPFVAAEWGEKATAIMWRIKALADPHGVLAPNVILTRNPNIHLENLKSVPQIEGVTDSSHCIECGFCEPVCPSRNVTMTPRQRIVLRRGGGGRQPPGSAVLARLQEEFQYDGIETCAGDGMCSIPCPIGINTGALIKEFRALENGPSAERIALKLARALERGRESIPRRAVGDASVCRRVRREAADGPDRLSQERRESRPPARRPGPNAAAGACLAADGPRRSDGGLFPGMHQSDLRS